MLGPALEVKRGVGGGNIYAFRFDISGMAKYDARGLGFIGYYLLSSIIIFKVQFSSPVGEDRLNSRTICSQDVP